MQQYIPDIIGLIGVTCVILSFFLLQAEKVRHDSWGYLLLNLFGALMLLYSLVYNWNLASVVIEAMWLTITTYGIIKYKMLKN